MNTIPTFKLSRLREIGWSHWDPIGINDLNDRPDDEYDSYLTTAAARLWRGESVEDVGAYLVDIEINYIGLGPQPDTKARASETAGAISNYVSELRN